MANKYKIVKYTPDKEIKLKKNKKQKRIQMMAFALAGIMISSMMISAVASSGLFMEPDHVHEMVETFATPSNTTPSNATPSNID